ncbi:MAG: peptide ABC transporter ATP-binding protein [Candidatus Dormiibacter spiritus]|nr:MAG: peptide ABC transporter ATP-binding protein [Candidatus Dormibacteraeota bacterium]
MSGSEAAVGRAAASNGSSGEPLLSVRGLKTYFEVGAKRVLKAVDGVDLDVHRGEVVGIVGESGCGKSMTCWSILRMIDRPGRIVGGSIRFEEEELVTKSETEMARLRGSRIAMVFQNPMTSLNPAFTVRRQMLDMIATHDRVSEREATDRAIELLASVGLPDVKRLLNDYAHQLSGGMRQRVLIAMALSCNPSLLIADEPTTALDVTVQSQILELLEQIQQQRGLSILIVSHDIGVIAWLCHKVAVMYAGRVVEAGPVTAVTQSPAHPYTQALLASIPTPDTRGRPLSAIEGQPPDLSRLPKGCAFAPRCPVATERSWKAPPDLTVVAPGHTVRCVLYEGTP